MIPIAQHLAEKLHANVRDDGSRSNSRPRDLYDMFVIARSLPIPDSNTLRATLPTDLRPTPHHLATNDAALWDPEDWAWSA